MNKILRNRLYIVIFGFAIFSLALNFVMQRFIARDEFHQSSHAIFDDIGHILKTNEAVIETVKANFKENCRLRAKVSATFIDIDKSIIHSSQKAQELARLLSVDEIHIFDENGVIVGGTVPSSYGLSVHSGEQIGFFKDMLLSKDIELAQDLMPNTAHGEMMQYAAVWMPCKEHFVQIGRDPRWVMDVLKHTTIEEIFKDIVLDSNAGIFALDASTLDVVASTNENLLRKNLKELGFSREDLRNAEDGINYSHNGKEFFVIVNEDMVGDNLILGKFIETKYLYRNVNFDSLILMFYLGLAAMVVVYAISRYLKYYVIDDIETVNDNLVDITNGNLNTRVSVNATPEFAEMGNRINMMVDSLKVNTRRVFEMCNKMNLPIGLYEYRDGMKKVSVTGNLAEILGLEGKENNAVFANRDLYEEKIEQIKQNLVDETHNIYRLPWAERYVRLQEDVYPDVTIGIAVDVTESYNEFSSIVRERDTDELTGLINRRSFFAKMEKLFQNAGELGYAGVFFVDANKLKYINDAFGHKAGDLYLCAIADIIRAWNAPEKIFCRFGGDEFVVFAYGENSKAELLDAFDELMYKMSNTFIEYEGEKIRVSFTVGAAFYPEHGTDFRALMRMADKNMLENKGKGTTTRHMLN